MTPAQNISVVNLDVSGEVLLGSWGTVTQITSITTGVTLNTKRGAITTVSAGTTAGSEDAFVVTNSTVRPGSVVIAHLAATTSAGTPVVIVTAVAAGSFTLTISNLHAANALNNTLTINFAVI